MKIRKKRQTVHHENNQDCVAHEYGFKNDEIDMAVIELSGRYPQKYWAAHPAEPPIKQKW